MELVWCCRAGRINIKIYKQNKLVVEDITVSDWYNLCRDFVLEPFKHRGKMGGKEYT